MDTVKHDPSYPRPQMRRAEWVSLDGPWRFTFDMRFRLPADVRAWSHTVQVPFCPESRKSGIGERGFHRACWYQREFEAPVNDDRVLLHFGAVDYSARVWVNGIGVAAGP